MVFYVYAEKGFIMLKVGDIVRLNNYPDESKYYGLIKAIRRGRYYKYPVIVVFFDDENHNVDYNEADLLKVS
jgi:catalase